ncbi:MAG: lysine biosynthesis protein LysW [Bdellovibrionales bacterium]|nr:lysine biosynthesis protein LysW [Bdellovibrionales bacterium]
MSDPNQKIVAISPITGAEVVLSADVEVGELVDDPETGEELEVVSIDPPELKPAPQEEEDWGE